MTIIACCCGASDYSRRRCCLGRVFPSLHLSISGTVAGCTGSGSAAMLQRFPVDDHSFELNADISFTPPLGVPYDTPPVGDVFCSYPVTWTDFFGNPRPGTARVYLTGFNFRCFNGAVAGGVSFWLSSPADLDGFLGGTVVSPDSSSTSELNLLSCNPLHITGSWSGSSFYPFDVSFEITE